MKWAQWYRPSEAFGFRNEISKQSCWLMMEEGKSIEAVFGATVRSNMDDIRVVRAKAQMIRCGGKRNASRHNTPVPPFRERVTCSSSSLSRPSFCCSAALASSSQMWVRTYLEAIWGDARGHRWLPIAGNETARQGLSIHRQSKVPPPTVVPHIRKRSGGELPAGGAVKFRTPSSGKNP